MGIQNIRLRDVASIISLLIFCLFPFTSDIPLNSNSISIIQYIQVFWESMTHLSIWPIFITTFIVGIFLAYQEYHIPEHTNHSQNLKNDPQNRIFSPIPSTVNISLDLSQGEGMAVQMATQQAVICIAGRVQRNWPFPFRESIVFIIVLLWMIFQAMQQELQTLQPSWSWHPFLYIYYHVYYAQDIRMIPSASCIDGKVKVGLQDHLNLNQLESDNKELLCFIEDQWDELSSGTLTPQNRDDVMTIAKGIRYAKEQSGGLLISFQANNNLDFLNVDFISSMTSNIESLHFFFSKISIVIFLPESLKNEDSNELLVTWSQNTKLKDYNIDIYYTKKDTKASDINHYFLSNHNQEGYSHILQADLTLMNINLSPMGIIHSIGLLGSDKIISSASTQVLNGSFGSIILPYNYESYNFLPTEEMDDSHHLAHILLLHRSGTTPVQIHSSCSGATIYPFKFIHEFKENEFYDAHDCVHLSNTYVFMNPKWKRYMPPDQQEQTQFHSQGMAFSVIRKIMAFIVVVHTSIILSYLFVIMSSKIKFYKRVQSKGEQKHN